MNPLKPFLSLDKQADLIISRGCLGEKMDMIEKLKVINYYRFSGYLYPYKKIDSKTGKRDNDFELGTSFYEVWNVYRFDRRLRMILLDAIERIEIALRTRIAYLWAEATQDEFRSNPQANSSSFQQVFLRKNEKGVRLYDRFMRSVQKNYDRSNADCAKHHKANGFTRVCDLPIWVFVEFTMFSDLTTLFKNGLLLNVSIPIANGFGVSSPKKLSQILALLREVRNHCAHHSRVWNCSWTYKPKRSIVAQPIAPKLNDDGTLKFSMTDQTKTGYILLLCDFMMEKVAPNSRWKKRFFTLYDEIPLSDFNLKQMGISRDVLEQWRVGK